MKGRIFMKQKTLFTKLTKNSLRGLGIRSFYFALTQTRLQLWHWSWKFCNQAIDQSIKQSIISLKGFNRFQSESDATLKLILDVSWTWWWWRSHLQTSWIPSTSKNMPVCGWLLPQVWMCESMVLYNRLASHTVCIPNSRQVFLIQPSGFPTILTRIESIIG